MIVLGRIAGPYGLHGWLKLNAYGDDVAALGSMSQWWLAREADAEIWTPMVLQGVKPHGKGWIVRFAGVDDRSAAEAIDGRYIGAPRQALPATAENEFYWADLVGLDVVNASGERLGTVTRLLSGGAHEVLCVSGGGDTPERMLPFVAQVVRRVDLGGGTIRVDWEADW